MAINLEKSVAEIAKERRIIIDKLINFGLTDMLLFWSSEENLFKYQQQIWEPILLWAKENLKTQYTTTTGLDIPPQDNTSGARLKSFLDNLTDKELTAFYFAALNMRSVLLAAALIKGKINAKQAFEASCLEELYQSRKWGQDEAAECRRQELFKELQLIEAFIR